MSKLYFINHNKTFFSTYVDKTIIIASPYKNKIESVKRIIDDYKSTHNSLLNNCLHMYDIEGSKVIKLKAFSSNSYVEQNNIMQISTEICQLDLEDSMDLDKINNILQLSNCDIFVMYNYQFYKNMKKSKLCDKHMDLTLQGIHVKNIETYRGECYDFIKHLNNIFDNYTS
jgi:hypothetical protein